MARALTLIEREAGDGQNFVKKGVSWALRAIAQKGPPKAAAAARALAANLATSDDAARRFVGKDEVKTLE